MCWRPGRRRVLLEPPLCEPHVQAECDEYRVLGLEQEEERELRDHGDGREALQGRVVDFVDDRADRHGAARADQHRVAVRRLGGDEIGRKPAAAEDELPFEHAQDGISLTNSVSPGGLGRTPQERVTNLGGVANWDKK